AVQAAVQTCLVQFVVGLGEVIQANIDIASLEQSTGGHKENLQTVFGRGQIAGDNQPLRLEAARQVCVVVQGDAIGRKTNHLIQRAIETGQRLLGQAINKIYIHRLEAGAAACDKRF